MDKNPGTPGPKTVSGCEVINYEHLWEDVTPSIVYTTNPLTYPSKERKCRNCGRYERQKLIQQQIMEWQEVKRG